MRTVGCLVSLGIKALKEHTSSFCFQCVEVLQTKVRHNGQDHHELLFLLVPLCFTLFIVDLFWEGQLQLADDLC
jgi:hypothetical protein